MAVRPWSWGKFTNLLQHIWPVVAIATFGGLAYNMRVMRGNLLDTLNMQYVETARAKGLSERKVIMRHAVPNALHPLVMYQGVVLPYMLTGEIEVAIIFALPTVGPAIVGIYAGWRCLCHGNVHAAALGHAADRQHHRRPSACGPRSARQTDREGCGMSDNILATVDTVKEPEANKNETYLALVWRPAETLVFRYDGPDSGGFATVHRRLRRLFVPRRPACDRSGLPAARKW